jgi:hypothetical protein
MIEQKLQNKVETVVADALENQLLDTVDAIDPAVDEAIKQQDQEISPPQPSVLESNEPVADPEPVQVAGLGSIAREALDGLKKRTVEAEKRVTMEAEEPPPVRQVEQSLVIAPADPDEVRLINEQLGGEYTKGLNFPDILASTGDFDAADYLAKFKDANQELFEQARRGTISFDRMLEMAQERGLDQIVFD